MKIIVLGELDGEKISNVTYELCAKACEITTDSVEIGAVFLDMNADKDIYTNLPCDMVYLLKCNGFAAWDHKAACKMISDCIRRIDPDVVLGGATAFGRSVLPRIAINLDTGLTADCIGLSFRKEDSRLVQTRPAFGGNILASIVCSRKPQMATVRPGVMAGSDIRKQPEIVIMDLDSGIQSVELVSYSGFQERTDIGRASVLVAGGKGIGGSKGFEQLFDLAKEIDGCVAATRSAVDAGWVGYAHQVGQTGRTVQPEVYLAFGISGSVQHMVGMQSSGLIIAINSDPRAPVFGVSDYGYIGDYRDVLSELLELYKGKNSG